MSNSYFPNPCSTTVVERPAPKEPLKMAKKPYYIAITLNNGKIYYNLLDGDHTHPSDYPSKFCLHGFSYFIDSNGQDLYIRNKDISAYSVHEGRTPETYII